MNYPAELKYSKSHEWIKMEGDVAVIGISDFAQDALGDVVFINLPEEGDSVAAGEAFGDVESVKAVSDLISPVSGAPSSFSHSSSIAFKYHAVVVFPFVPVIPVRIGRPFS